MFSTLIVIAVALPASAIAWTPRHYVSPAGQQVSVDPPQVAVDSAGDAVYVWGNDTAGRIQARTQAADGTLGAQRIISPPGGLGPQVAVDPAGDAVFVWMQGNGAGGFFIEARTLSAGGVLGAIETITPDGCELPQVAVDSVGDSVISWGNGFVAQARTMSAGGSLGPVKTLSHPANRVDHEPTDVAVDSAGDAVFTWSEHGFGEPNRIGARTMSAGGTLGPRRYLSAPGGFANDAHVGVDSTGDAVFVWRRQGNTGADRIQERTMTAGGTLGAVQALAADGERPQVAVNASGDAAFTWDRFSRVEGRTLIGGTLGATQAISSPTATQTAWLPDVGVDSSGNAVFVWQLGSLSPIRAQARTLSAGGALGTIDYISGQDSSYVVPQVAVNAAGDAAATFLHQDSAGTRRVQGTLGP